MYNNKIEPLWIVRSCVEIQIAYSAKHSLMIEVTTAIYGAVEHATQSEIWTEATFMYEELMEWWWALIGKVDAIKSSCSSI